MAKAAKDKKVQKAKQCRIAVLDDECRLVGYRLADAAGPDDVAVPFACDLPPDGSYCWNREARQFVKAGHEAMLLRPPIGETEVVYHLAKAMENPPDEVTQWLRWYERRTGRARGAQGFVGASDFGGGE